MAAPSNPKAELRKALLARRRALPAETVAAAGEAVVERLLRAPWFAAARTIGLYAAVGGEVPLGALLFRVPEATFAFPRVERGQRTLGFWALEPGTRLVPGALGIPTPPGQGCRAIPLEALELILVPGVAFDRDGHRLGQGGGYYDSTLPATPALRVGIAHPFQLLETVPHELHDAGMHHLVTPECVLHGLGKAAK